MGRFSFILCCIDTTGSEYKGYANPNNYLICFFGLLNVPFCLLLNPVLCWLFKHCVISSTIILLCYRDEEMGICSLVLIYLLSLCDNTAPP